jgi:hypothetical protein
MGTKDETGMLGIISERTSGKDEEMCACCIDWQKAHDHVNWTKLMWIPQETDVYQWKRKFISK